MKHRFDDFDYNDLEPRSKHSRITRLDPNADTGVSPPRGTWKQGPSLNETRTYLAKPRS